MTKIIGLSPQNHKYSIEQHLFLLDLDSRHQRFNFAINDEALVKYAHSFGKSDILVGIFVQNSHLHNKYDSINSEKHINSEGLTLESIHEEILAGFLHIAVGTNSAEVGISVLKEYQGNKLASAMMVMGLFMLKDKIAEDGLDIDDVIMYCDANNPASINLGKKFGLKVIVEGYSNQYEIAQTKSFKLVSNHVSHTA